MNPTHRSLEDAWSERLRIALTCYRLAASETRLMQAERENGLMPEPDGSFAYRRALQKEKEALAEYPEYCRYSPISPLTTRFLRRTQQGKVNSRSPLVTGRDGVPLQSPRLVCIIIKIR